MDTGEVMRNPHTDDNLVVWDDAYEGRYSPVIYSNEFDDQWRLNIERRIGVGHPVEPDDIGECVNFLRDKFGNFAGKKCLDVGCGLGRWTRALQQLGGTVTSTDVSKASLESTRRFNTDTRALDLFEVGGKLSDYDFVMSWGVLMCTHNPAEAFRSVASTCRGMLYIMVYAPEGMHGDITNAKLRKVFHKLPSLESRIKFAFDLAKGSSRDAIGWFDALNPFYNWTIPETVAYEWFHKAGFKNVRTLNATEHPRCAHHIVGEK